MNANLRSLEYSFCAFWQPFIWVEPATFFFFFPGKNGILFPGAFLLYIAMHSLCHSCLLEGIFWKRVFLFTLFLLVLLAFLLPSFASNWECFLLLFFTNPDSHCIVVEPIPFFCLHFPSYRKNRTILFFRTKFHNYLGSLLCKICWLYR